MSNDAIVKKMVEDLNLKIKEARELYNTLQALKRYGADFDLPNLERILIGQNEELSLPDLSIRPDQFFGLSNTEAAENYLKIVGHAMPLTDIYNALMDGGITFTGDGKKNLYTQLVRATKKFAKIGSGQGLSFGLLDWYPKKRNTAKLDKNGNTENSSDQLSEDVDSIKVTRLKRQAQSINPVTIAGNTIDEEENKV